MFFCLPDASCCYFSTPKPVQEICIPSSSFYVRTSSQSPGVVFSFVFCFLTVAEQQSSFYLMRYPRFLLTFRPRCLVLYVVNFHIRSLVVFESFTSLKECCTILYLPTLLFSPLVKFYLLLNMFLVLPLIFSWSAVYLSPLPPNYYGIFLYFLFITCYWIFLLPSPPPTYLLLRR